MLKAFILLPLKVNKKTSIQAKINLFFFANAYVFAHHAWKIKKNDVNLPSK